MSQEEARIMINQEMDDVKSVATLKAHSLLNQFKENRRNSKVVF